MKICSNGPENMTEMAAMPTYGKNYLKIFFSGTNRPRALKLSMQNWGFNFNKRDVIHVSKRICCFFFCFVCLFVFFFANLNSVLVH